MNDRRFYIMLTVAAIVIVAVAVSVTVYSVNPSTIAQGSVAGISPDRAEFDFVARGIVAGMSPEDVQALMSQAHTAVPLMDNTDNGSEPYAAFYHFRNAVRVMPGTGRNLPGLSEYYTVFFDESKHAKRIEYEVFQKRGGTQRVEADLEARKLSDRLAL